MSRFVKRFCIAGALHQRCPCHWSSHTIRLRSAPTWLIYLFSVEHRQIYMALSGPTEAAISWACMYSKYWPVPKATHRCSKCSLCIAATDRPKHLYQLFVIQFSGSLALQHRQCVTAFLCRLLPEYRGSGLQ